MRIEGNEDENKAKKKEKKKIVWPTKTFAVLFVDCCLIEADSFLTVLLINGTGQCRGNVNMNFEISN
jgi:hypothetical protein